jgi:hypothetical protein
MAEALAGLSVAANVMQVINFSVETISVCKQIYDSKSPAPEKKSNAQSLQAAVDDLQRSLPSLATSSPRDRELHHLATRLLALTGEIQIELQKCQIPQGTSKLRVIGKALKYNLSRKRKVESFESSIDGLEQIMQTRILVDLRQTLNDDTNAIQISLDDLTERMQHFAIQLKAGHTDLQSLMGAKSGEIQSTVVQESRSIQHGVALESSGVRQHVSNEAEKTRRQLEDVRIQQMTKARQERILKSLYFNEMNARSSQVTDAHEGTFKWIFGGEKQIENEYFPENQEMGQLLRLATE